jgi:aerobic-type carbon monoxide dehydrogenase small subunit (CoxS/CutS family)
MLAVQANGRSIETIEGLAQGGELSELQRALAEHHGMQCGYCTPGVLMTLKELLSETKHELSEAEVRKALSGNLCRCTGYQGIVDAALALLRKEVQFTATARTPEKGGPSDLAHSRK